MAGAWRAFALAGCAGLALSLGCSKTRPDGVCDHEAKIVVKELKEFGAKVTDEELKDLKKKCIADAERIQAENKAKWDCLSKCILGASSTKQLDDCEKKCG